ncbi:hypothetical protein NDU88_000163 [Pleurodeles waltl]|uniref:Uncharacterized protein n=1 Tax=Pleurodeles waltl TaxID=8319 RepID=A0AAV7VSP7_PLEWA|nr:hypothetical protein NDU88_000163 [Pleurodeles waltl]
MPLWGRKKSEAESGRQHEAEVRSIPGWLATDPFSGVAGLLNQWPAPVVWEALDEKLTPLLVENAAESVKLGGAKLELKAAGQVGWLFLSALCTVYRKTLTQDAEIRKLRDEVAALQERQLLMKETIESAVTRGDQMEAGCTALVVRVAKQKSRQKPKMPSTVQVRALISKQKSRQKRKMPSTVQVRALVRKENWDPYTWDGTVSDNDDWNWEDEVEVRVTELGGVESGEGRVGEIEGEKGVNGGQIQNYRLVRDYTQIARYPGAKPGGKSSGKHSRQLLFSEALVQPKVMATQGTSPGSASSPAASPPLETTDRILQEIAAVGRRLETMDARISELTIASSSIWADIAGFRETVHNLDQHLTAMEEHVVVLSGQEAELRSLRAKVTDMEDRSCRDNIRLFGILEHKEGSDVKTFLKNLLPELTGLEYSPPLEFQTVHRIGPLHRATPGKPWPIIACFLRHV